MNVSWLTETVHTVLKVAVFTRRYLGREGREGGGGEDQYKHVYIIHIYGFMYNVYVCESTL